ncbi:IS66 family insertion sequence element accessory protein TnpB [Bradyrhizobium sp. 147]|nr:IS66 family insertion sequence element accessory protein TnpB [Bradyrhizobium sp. 179]MCK1680103.1 IS66 family insertion sequence element accessory protein TnpB [Bradyrhizobium sp. 147]
MWIATGHTDMRRRMGSLALLVQDAFTRDPHGRDLDVFRGKSGKLIKILGHMSWACRSVPNDWSAAPSLSCSKRSSSKATPTSSWPTHSMPEAHRAGGELHSPKDRFTPALREPERALLIGALPRSASGLSKQVTV